MGLEQWVQEFVKVNETKEIWKEQTFLLTEEAIAKLDNADLNYERAVINSTINDSNKALNDQFDRDGWFGEPWKENMDDAQAEAFRDELTQMTNILNNKIVTYMDTLGDWRKDGWDLQEKIQGTLPSVASLNVKAPDNPTVASLNVKTPGLNESIRVWTNALEKIWRRRYDY